MTRVVKKPEERRLELVRAARQLFQTKDFEQATMQDLMASVGIAKGTIYHYFKSKNELLEAVVEDMVSERLQKMEKSLAAADGNALDKFQILVEGARLADEQPEVLKHLHKPGNEAMHTRLLAAAIQQQAPLYAQLIQEGCDQGIFRSQHPLECAEFILAAFQFLTDVGIGAWTEEDLSRRADALPILIEQLLQAPSGSFDFLKEALP